MTYVYIGLGLLVIIIILRKITKNNNLPILKANINTNDGFTYNVVFEKLNPQTTSIEYLRLILSFISKIYFMSNKNETTREDIKFLLNEFGESDDLDTAVRMFNRRIQYTDYEFNSGEYKSIVATAIFKDIHTRSINTKIPTTWYSNQLFTSIIALLIEGTKKLDLHQKDILFRSLKNLNNYYKSQDANSIKSAYEFPNRAFLEATLNYS
jgi:hypothetical protein